jgi:hypothetical protein
MSQSFQSFVGVDLHQCTVTLTAVDPIGEKLAQLKISTKSVGKIEDWPDRREQDFIQPGTHVSAMRPPRPVTA